MPCKIIGIILANRFSLVAILLAELIWSAKSLLLVRLNASKSVDYHESPIFNNIFFIKIYNYLIKEKYSKGNIELSLNFTLLQAISGQRLFKPIADFQISLIG